MSKNDTLIFSVQYIERQIAPDETGIAQMLSIVYMATCNILYVDLHTRRNHLANLNEQYHTRMLFSSFYLNEMDTRLSLTQPHVHITLTSPVAAFALTSANG